MSFAVRLIDWQRRHGRRDLPWQGTRDPYRIWLSEVMLQQTQVSAVIPYYQRFVRRFPTLEALAGASEEEVLGLWSGLGYYARGRNLLKAARQIARQGRFPRSAAAIAELPGIGRSSAAAIAAFAFGERAAILDGNVKRVLARCYGVEAEGELWPLAERLLPDRHIGAYTQALMDLGATVCLRGKPNCAACPVGRQCVARKQGRIAELPAVRPKKPVPLRRATWYVYLHGGKVLLERRPGAGLWGGLWTFPERRLWQRGEAVKLAPLEHGFTHFRLRVQPVLQRIAGRAKPPPGRRWMPIPRALQGAVPAPVRNVLRSVLSRSVPEPDGRPAP